MDFSWSSEQIALKDKALKFAQDKLNDTLIEMDRRCEFTRQKWIDCAAFAKTIQA